MAAAGGARLDVMDMEADRSSTVAARVLVSVVDVLPDDIGDFWLS